MLFVGRVGEAATGVGKGVGRAGDGGTVGGMIIVGRVGEAAAATGVGRAGDGGTVGGIIFAGRVAVKETSFSGSTAINSRLPSQSLTDIRPGAVLVAAVVPSGTSIMTRHPLRSGRACRPLKTYILPDSNSFIRQCGGQLGSPYNNSTTRGLGAKRIPLANSP